MRELPEAAAAAQQLEKALKGKRVARVVAGHTPHKFAFFLGDAQGYPALLQGRRFCAVQWHGMFVQLDFEGTALLLGDGVNLRLLEKDQPLPAKHQLLLQFDDGTALVASVQMYGAIWACPANELDNAYYTLAKEKPSPLSDAFDLPYFLKMAAEAKQTLSAKAFLATEQRIPGLGNGVLQDILFEAGIHPKTKLETLDEKARERLFHIVKGKLADMAAQGGRDTEKDIYGQPGGYKTQLSAKTAGGPCPVCGAVIQKQAYLGGSVYFCPVCQKQ